MVTITWRPPAVQHLFLSIYFNMLPGCPVSRAKQSSIPTSHKVSESKRALGSGRIDEVSLAASATKCRNTGWFFNKMNKATVLHYLLEDLSSNDLPYPQDALFIQDGMALFHTLTNLPPTCGEICLQVLDQMAVKKNFIFSTDSYHENSIKAQERMRRGSSERILLAGPATRKPFDFKVFLENDENKKQLCQLMLRVWSAQQAFVTLQNTEMAVLIVEGKAYQLTPSNGEVSFFFTFFHSLLLFS